MTTRLLATLLACFLLAACGGDKTATGGSATGDDGLPKPAGAAGSVTGMPNPGASTPDPGQPGAIETAPEDATTETANVDTPADAEPRADAAVAVVRAYYAAINARDYATAYAQWRDGGGASGQSAQQFADGFASTQGVSVQIGTPGAIDAGAGQRHIEIPVTVESHQADGSIRRYAGSYVLGLTVVDGATPEQRSWHIASANLREVVQ